MAEIALLTASEVSEGLITLRVIIQVFFNRLRNMCRNVKQAQKSRRNEREDFFLFQDYLIEQRALKTIIHVATRKQARVATRQQAEP
jgi:hypothetical protein